MTTASRQARPSTHPRRRSELNDRCQEAVDAIDAGVPIPDTPPVRELIRAILMDGVEGIGFFAGIREVALEIRDAAPQYTTKEK